MLYVGQILYGYCDGYFGRDSYEDKRIEAVGVDWVVARGCNSGGVAFAHGSDDDGASIHEVLGEFTKPPEDEGEI